MLRASGNEKHFSKSIHSVDISKSSTPEAHIACYSLTNRCPSVGHFIVSNGVTTKNIDDVNYIYAVLHSLSSCEHMESFRNYVINFVA